MPQQVFGRHQAPRTRSRDAGPISSSPAASIASDRPIAVDEMNVTAGTLRRDFTLTVQPGGSFAKTAGRHPLSSSRTMAPSARTSALDAPTHPWTTVSDLRVAHRHRPRPPGLHINQDFTIGSGRPPPAPSNAGRSSRP